MERNINVESSETIINYHCPRFNELPKVSLYKDQVITYIEDVLNPININKEEKILTPTMLNSYVKQKVVSPPKDKKYNEKHLAYLIVVCTLKHVFSLHDICILINKQLEKYPVEIAYDYFCIELEKSLKAVFDTRDFSEPSSAVRVTYESEIGRSTIMSFAHKLFIQRYIME